MGRISDTMSVLVLLQGVTQREFYLCESQSSSENDDAAAVVSLTATERVETLLAAVRVLLLEAFDCYPELDPKILVTSVRTLDVADGAPVALPVQSPSCLATA